MKDLKLRRAIRTVCKQYKLTNLVNEDELLELVLRYRKAKPQHMGQTYNVLTESVLMLYLRRNRIPTPLALWKATTQGRGDRRQSSGYMDVLKEINGVRPAKPEEYIETFPTTEEIKIEATRILKQYFGRRKRQGKNPRVIAGVCLYATGHFLQIEVCRKLHVSTVAVRNYWRDIRDFFNLPKTRVSRLKRLKGKMTDEKKSQLKRDFPELYDFLFAHSKEMKVDWKNERLIYEREGVGEEKTKP